MTTISTDEIQHLADLSGFELTPDDIANLETSLPEILSWVGQLSEVDTAGVEPTFQLNNPQNVWREDEVRDSGVTREQLIALAPESAANQIEVPKVL